MNIPDAAEPLFWMTMQYRCDVGETEVVRYLEVGCEGGGVDDETRLETPPAPSFIAQTEIVSERFIDKIEVKYTASGRRVVPVPFVAGRCANGHTMSHCDWHSDRALTALIPASQIPARENLASSAPSVFIFRYPPDAHTNYNACGIPSEWFPAHGMARTEQVVHHHVDPETGLWVEKDLR